MRAREHSFAHQTPRWMPHGFPTLSVHSLPTSELSSNRHHRSLVGHLSEN